MNGHNPSRPASLQSRLLWTALSGLALAALVGAWGLSAAFAKAVERGFDERLKTVLQTLVAEVETTADGALVLSRPIGDPRFEKIYSGSYWQISNAQGVLLRSRSLWDQEIPFSVAPPDGSTLFRVWQNPAGQQVRLAERDLTLPGRPEVLHFIVAGRSTEIDAEMRQFDRLLLVGVLGLVLLMALAVALQVRVGLRPLRGLLADLEAVWQGRLQRVDETLPRELAPLAAAVNQLLNHDDRAIVRARGQAADLAHAIKTPLAVLRTDVDGLDPVVAAGMRERLDLIDGLVRRNLTRAAPGAGGPQSALGSQVRPVAEQMCALMRRVHPTRGIETVLTVPDDVYVRLAGRTWRRCWAICWTTPGSGPAARCACQPGSAADSAACAWKTTARAWPNRTANGCCSGACAWMSAAPGKAWGCPLRSTSSGQPEVR